MSVYNSDTLLTSLENDVKYIIDRATELTNIDGSILNRQPAAGSWSAAQVLEHLNSYNRYYLPEINKSLQNKTSYNAQFKPGVFGNYFTKIMLPGKDGKVANKMNSPKDHRPAETLDTNKVLAEFIAGQQKLHSYLEQAKTTDIGRLKVPISISKFIKLKMGDTFRFLIAHQQRHFIQLEKALITAHNK